MLAEQQKVRIRHALGYSGVSQASTFALGVPAGVQTNYVIEGAMNRVMPQNEAMVETLLQRCEAVEQQIVDNSLNVEATKVGEIELNPKALTELGRRYRVWQEALANLLLAPVNPYDQRSWLGGGEGVTNVRVNH